MSFNLKDFSNNYNSEELNRIQMEKRSQGVENQKIESERNFESYSNDEISKAKEQAQSFIEKHQNMSNDELNQLLFNEIAKQKANGTFDKNKLLTMLENVKGLLPNQKQYETLHNFLINL